MDICLIDWFRDSSRRLLGSRPVLGPYALRGWCRLSFSGHLYSDSICYLKIRGVRLSMWSASVQVALRLVLRVRWSE